MCQEHRKSAQVRQLLDDVLVQVVSLFVSHGIAPWTLAESIPAFPQEQIRLARTHMRRRSGHVVHSPTATQPNMGRFGSRPPTQPAGSRSRRQFADARVLRIWSRDDRDWSGFSWGYAAPRRTLRIFLANSQACIETSASTATQIDHNMGPTDGTGRTLGVRRLAAFPARVAAGFCRDATIRVSAAFATGRECGGIPWRRTNRALAIHPSLRQRNATPRKQRAAPLVVPVFLPAAWAPTRRASRMRSPL